VQPSLRAQLVATVFGISVMSALLLAPQPDIIWRGLAAALVVGLGWKPVRVIIFGRGAGAVRSIEWQADGQWRVLDSTGRRHPAELAPASATLGPWLLLAWKTPSRTRFYALIDSACTEATAFRALKGRLNC